MLFACAQDSQERLKAAIREHGLNRVVVASCSPRTHEPLFQQTIREAGLNRFLFTMTNIREQCAWVHARHREAANAKARDLLRMAVASARLARELHERPQSIRRRALVVGGGLAGLTATLALRRLGFPVTLVEREAQLGGRLRELRWTIDGESVAARLGMLIERVEADSGIEVLRPGLLVDVAGFIGNFTSQVLVGVGGYSRTVEHGVTIVATGAKEWTPEGYRYGGDERVITQSELERRLADGLLDPLALNNVVMIQCVGSRDADRPYCSRVCCSMAVKNALRLKAQNPALRVTVLVRDLRTYGLLEEHALRARRMGVTFVRWDPDRPPEVATEDERLVVRVRSGPRGAEAVLAADLVVLAAATVAEENRELAELLKVPRTADGFFLEAHQKLRPVDFATEGVFLCGTAHGPKSIPETIAQAEAAAARAATILARPVLMVGGVVSKVDPERCAACLCCVRACPYGVPRISAEGAAEIEPAQCQGCGVCAAECPGKAIDLQHFTDAQLSAISRAFGEAAG
jgi:heterodisulfide reductase subunit A-like polyferredoxin